MGLYCRPVSPSDDDRARILLRRAAFVSGTLAALGGCGASRSAEPATAPKATAVSIPKNETEEPPSAPVPETPRTKPSGKPGEMPSFEIPSNIGQQARESFERLFSNMKRMHPVLDQMEQLVPGCSVLDAKCEEAWRRLAVKQNELREIQTFLYTCPGTSADAKLFAEREREHLDYLEERKRSMLHRIRKALEPDGSRGEERWEKLVADAYSAAPYPCLSIACKDW